MTDFHNPLPHIGLTVDIVIFTVRTDQLKVLLIQREIEPFTGQLSLPGGYLQEGELAHEAVERVLQDKTGVRAAYSEQLYTFDAVKRDPRGRIISVVYFALIPEDQLMLPASNNTQHPDLYSVRSLGHLAFDHNQIIDYAVERLRSKLEYTNIVYSLLPQRFTMSQLQAVYEAILDRSLDKRNFLKKYASLDLIRATSKQTSGGSHRPARLYEFKSSSPAQLRKFF